MKAKLKNSFNIHFLFIFLLCCSCKPATNPSFSYADGPKYYEVTKVVDGDTFWIDDGTAKGIKVRLIGIDAPESRKSFKKQVGYFGKESKNYLTNLLKGKKVKLEFDVDKLDQYGRTLAYAYTENGTFVNADLLKNGFAIIMTIPPNIKYADRFYILQQKARETKKGLWRINP